MNKKLIGNLIILALIAGSTATCKNPLITKIHEEVEIAVTPPEIAQVYPSISAVDVPVNTSNITIIFTKNVDASTVNTGSIIITNEAGVVEPGSFTVSAESITYTLSRTLTYSTTYSIQVTKGVKDTDGNSLTSAFTWSFTTGLSPDTTVPSLTGLAFQSTVFAGVDTDADNTADEFWTGTQAIDITLAVFDERGVTHSIIAELPGFLGAEWAVYNQTTNTIEYTLSPSDGEKTLYIKVRDGSGNESAVITGSIHLDTSGPAIDYFELNNGNQGTLESLITIDIIGLDSGIGVAQYRIRNAGEEWKDWIDLTTNNVHLNNYPLSVSANQEQHIQVQMNDVLGNESVIEERSITLDFTPPSVDEDATFPRRSATVPQNTSLIKVVFNERISPESFDAGNMILSEGVTPLDTKLDFSLDKKSVSFLDADFQPLELNQNTDYTVFIGASIEDEAGNQMGSNYSYYFSTNTAVDTDPPEGMIALDIDNPEVNYSANNNLALQIFAEDRFNNIYGVKIWGDNTAGRPFFEQDAVWESYVVDSLSADGIEYMDYSTAPESIVWTLTNISGKYNIYYRFMDAAQNVTETPGRLQVILDLDNPYYNATTPFIFEGGKSYSKNQDGIITISLNAKDDHSGISQVWISTVDESGLADGARSWQDWAPVLTDFTLTEGEGAYTIYSQVKDKIGHNSATASDTIILDYTQPEVSLDVSQILNTNSLAQQSITYTDPDPATGPGPASGVAQYEWEQLSGPVQGETVGQATFYDDPAGTEEDINTRVPYPYISADMDGEYELLVTITDNAGNENFSTVPFIWDTVSPSDITNVLLYEDNGTQTTYYATTAQPYVKWDPSTGADFYIIFTNGLNAAPNWEAYDWNDPSSYMGTTPYIRNNTPVVTAPPPSGPASNDGLSRLFITGWDVAGNRTQAVSCDLFIDTVAPTIVADGTYILTREAVVIDFSSSIIDDHNEDGSFDPEHDSGINAATYAWTMAEGPGVITFGGSGAASLNPTISASTDGLYALMLSVADNAGNISTGYAFVQWDTTAPNAPSLSGFDHTRDTTPVWSWIPGGGGIGVFRYRLNGGSWSSETTATSYEPASGLADNSHNTLEVQERDEAGNWSVSGALEIWVDSTAPITPPNLIRQGTYLRNASQTSITWDWSSGTGAPTAYRYRIDSGVWTTVSEATQTFTYIFSTNGSADGLHHFYIEEQINGSEWTGEIASDEFVIDATPPDMVDFDSPSTTNDTTPSWEWFTNGGGIEVYRYRLNGGAWVETTSTSFTLTTAQSNGATPYLGVQERDEAGNWSTESVQTITIDTVAPTFDSFTIDNGDTYTTDLSVIIQASASGSPSHIRFKNSGGTWSGWYANPTQAKSWNLASGEGYKYVEAQLRDAAGNESAQISDYIILDTVVPAVTSMSLNNSGKSTLNQTVTVNSDVSGANFMRLRNGNGAWSGWYSYTSSRAWNMSAGYGVKKVSVQYTDAAGYYENDSSHFIERVDYIFFGAPVLRGATKGKTSNGTLTLTFDTYGNESGTTLNYYAYYATSPTGTKTYKTSVSSGNSITLTGMAQGTLYYLYLLPNNTSAGGSSDVYSEAAVSWSSNITIIYDGTDSEDQAKAQSMKNLLEDHDFPNISTSISGTMPYWTVTMVPDSLISADWTETDDRYIIYGDPIIITPSFAPYSNSNKLRNIVHKSNTTGNAAPATASGASGVVAMGYYGSNFLYYVNKYWTDSWNYPTGTEYTQPPANIGFAGPSGTFSTEDIFMITWTSGNSTWNSPLSSTTFPGGANPNHNASTQYGYSDDPLGGSGSITDRRISVYLSTDQNPPYGYIYCRDSYESNPHYFPVVRQGRFLHYGFPRMATRPYTGEVHFINLIARMDDY
ncbi:MAG: Ig-like domain-containing protein [Spirochaetales bacterium]|nr:Ig-like domain-containing protein [Spirochaetales bacterium]